MRIALTYLIAALTVGEIPRAVAFGYVAPEAMEIGVAECSGKNLNSFDCARGIERKTLSAESKAVRRSGNTLQLRLEKQTIRLVDDPTGSGDSPASYSYLGFSRKLMSHILHVQYPEGNVYMVIHHRSGKRALPSGYPLASPDGQHFLSLSEDMFAGYNPNNIEIWQVRSGGFRRVANHAPEWGPHNGNWASDQHALIEKQCYAQEESNPAGLKPCGVAKVERLGSTWKLVDQ